MAKARIGRSGVTVKLSLDFREAAALHALLTKVSGNTDSAIEDATMDTFFALDDVMHDLRDQNVRPAEFDSFTARDTELVEENL